MQFQVKAAIITKKNFLSLIAMMQNILLNTRFEKESFQTECVNKVKNKRTNKSQTVRTVPKSKRNKT
jgi:hypothetical protein